MKLPLKSSVEFSRNFEDYRRCIKVAYLVENPREFLNDIKSIKFQPNYIEIKDNDFIQLRYIRPRYGFSNVSDTLDEFKLPDAYDIKWKPDYKFIGLLSGLIGFFFIPIESQIMFWLAVGALLLLTYFTCRFFICNETNYMRMVSKIEKIIKNHERLDNIKSSISPFVDYETQLKRSSFNRFVLNKSLYGKRKAVRNILNDIDDRRGKV